MAYTSYSTCDETLDVHYDRGCGDTTSEKARLRKGAWIHSSRIDEVLADPTVLASWTPGVLDSTIILLPELSGNFDGGTPKTGGGYGDAKDEYLGADFKATINDPLYKSNWAHYRSLVGKTQWHFAYCSETQIHISDVPVTVAPKNPINDNIEDSVIWTSDVTWFEFFTPAPHDIPDGLFD